MAIIGDITIGIDINGESEGNTTTPDNVSKALLRFQSDFPDVSIALFGNPDEAYSALKENSIDTDNIEILRHPAYYKGLRKIVGSAGKTINEKKQETSLHGILNSLKGVGKAKIDCAYSMGDTAPLISYASRELGMIKGIDLKWPPLITEIPKSNGGSFLFTDIGATVDTTPEEMLYFAIMCDTYVKNTMGQKEPKIGILSNGSEKYKGNQFVKCLDKEILEYNNSAAEPLNYCGFVEGKYGIFEDDTAIVLAEGFNGNTNLKTLEGVFMALKKRVELAASSLKKGSIKSRIGLGLAYLGYKMISGSEEVRNFKKDLDPDMYDGAPLLGLNHCLVKGHGNSTPFGIYNGLRRTIEYYRSGTIDHLKERFRGD